MVSVKMTDYGHTEEDADNAADMAAKITNPSAREYFTDILVGLFCRYDWFDADHYRKWIEEHAVTWQYRRRQASPSYQPDHNEDDGYHD